MKKAAGSLNLINGVRNRIYVNSLKTGSDTSINIFLNFSLAVDKNERTLTAITPLHFPFITKYVAHFVAQSLLFPMVAITLFFQNAR